VKELSSGSRSGVILRDNPLHVDHINRFWDRFSAAMRDKDLAIQAELSRQVFRVPRYKVFCQLTVVRPAASFRQYTLVFAEYFQV